MRTNCIVCSILLVLVTRAFADDVTITKLEDGNFIAASVNYTAKIGSDGNLHSLVSNGTEFLLDGYKGLVAGGYLNIKESSEWSVDVFKFSTVTQTAPDMVTAVADKHKLGYKFSLDGIELQFSHTTEPTIWYMTFNPLIKDILEHQSGEAIPPKTTWRDGVPQLFNDIGSNMTLPHGATYYIAKNSNNKPDTDPMVHQIWMPRTWGDQVMTQQIKIHAKPTAADALQATLVVPGANHLFPGGMEVLVGISSKLRFPGSTVDGKMELLVKDYLTKKETLHQVQAIKLASMDGTKTTFTFTPSPGFYEASILAKQGEDLLVTRSFPFAYDLAHIPLPERPLDFDEYWEKTLSEQEKITPNIQLTLFKEEPTHKLYKLRFDGLMGRHFNAWLSLPAKEGKYPAHLTLPPSGINVPYLPMSGPEVVGMSLAIAGQEVERTGDRYPTDPYFRDGWDYFQTGIESRETWYYRVVFAACSRAIDILVSRPETDPTRIFVAGGSQGGGLSFITAALNSKVTMAVCGSPGLFGLEWKLRYLPHNYWPPIDVVDDKRQAVDSPESLEKRIAVVRYFDAANFASRIKGAVLLNVGLQDAVTSQAGTLAAWSRLSNTTYRAILADPWGGHNGPRGGQGLGSAWWMALVNKHLEQVLEYKEAGGLPVIVEKRKN